MISDAVGRIVRYAAGIARPERIILFGSYAAGKVDLHSDVDLLIVASWTHGRREIQQRIADFAAECALDADVLIRTPAEIEQAQMSGRSCVVSTAMGQGQIVYERRVPK